MNFKKLKQISGIKLLIISNNKNKEYLSSLHRSKYKDNERMKNNKT